MGRYYNGDIDGKFWFGVQSSNSADRFGSSGYEPQYLEYYFDEDNLDDATKEIESIEEHLGNRLPLLKKFFEDNEFYNDEMVSKMYEENKFKGENIYSDLSHYADLLLGRKIKECILTNGSCEFTAEI
jgi:hypothetical protein